MYAVNGENHVNIVNTDGSSHSVTWTTGMDICDFANVTPNPTTYYAYYCTAKKDGWFLCLSDGLAYRTVGQIINTTSHAEWMVYFGDVNPFE